MSASPRSASGVVAKRLLVGRAFSSQRLEHTLLPKILALPVFASDALSSVAYATGEILLALTLVTADPQPLVMPIAVAIAVLLAVVVASYRQTVRAYPGGGGAYIVSKENLGQFAGLVAAAALLFDYMMTVVVSIVAGVVAIQSAFPEAAPYAVPLCVMFVAFVTLANLRGSKESGVLFAVPTYGFVLAIGTLIVIGLARCTTGCPAIPEGVEIEPLHDAATTLAVMGAISITLFLGISWLATHVEGVIASEERSVPAQISIAVFGEGSIGFFVVQFFTSAILILAANTAYQDFPRLASILGRDRFLPSQFVNRGDRLVFSNGVIVLGVASAVMIWIFDASLTAVIHLYVVGVFTSFTLSQAGMIRHWIAEGRKGDAAQKGWRRSIVINAVGCVTTSVVLVVVILSKFMDGAWLSILLMALLVPAFYGIHHHYGWVRQVLRRGTQRPGAMGRNHVVLLVHDLDASTAEAVGYLKSFRPEDVHVVTRPRDGEVPRRLLEQWTAFAGSEMARPEPLPSGSLTHAMRSYVRALPRDPGDFVTVMIPEVVRDRLASYLIRKRDLVRLKGAMLKEPDVVVTDVPVVAQRGEPVGVGRVRIPARTVTFVFLSSVNDLTIRAVNYARTLGAGVTRAIYFDLDPEQAHRLEEAWFAAGLEVPLDIVEAPFRDLTTPMLEEVRRYSSRADTIVNVVIPEAVVTRWWQYPLHNQNALFVKRLFLYEDRVVLTSVPFLLRRHPGEPAETVTT